MATPNGPIGSKRAQNDPKKGNNLKKARKQKSLKMKIISVYE